MGRYGVHWTITFRWTTSQSHKQRSNSSYASVETLLFSDVDWRIRVKHNLVKFQQHGNTTAALPFAKLQHHIVFENHFQKWKQAVESKLTDLGWYHICGIYRRWFSSALIIQFHFFFATDLMNYLNLSWFTPSMPIHNQIKNVDMSTGKNTNTRAFISHQVCENAGR